MSLFRTDADWDQAVSKNRAIALEYGLDGAIQIYRSRYFWPMEPEHPGNDIDIETIAHALSVMSRWGGQTSTLNGSPLRYSVAQHSVHVADIAQLNRHTLVPGWRWDAPNITAGSPALYGLLHDSPEGYGFADLVSPVKVKVVGYREGEDALMGAINRTFDTPMDQAIREAVRRVDNMMMFLERDELVGPPPIPYTNEMDHPRVSIHDLVPDFRVWSEEESKQRFLDKFAEIKTGSGNIVPIEYLDGRHRL